MTNERGQNLVEFALVVPIFALTIFAIFEFGNAFRTQIQLQNAMREGSRFAAIGGPANYHGTGVSGGGSTGCPSQADIQTVVRGAASGLAINVSAPTYNPSPCGACTSLTNLPELTVSGSYGYTPITPIGGIVALLGKSLTITLPTEQSTVYYEGCD